MGLTALAETTTAAPRTAPWAEARPRASGTAAPPARRRSMRRLLGHATPATWAYFDFALVLALTWLVHRLLILSYGGYTWVAGPLLSGLTCGGCVTLAGLVFGLYEGRTLGARSRIVVRSVMTAGLGLILAHACIFLLFYGATTRWLGFLVALLYTVIAVPVRLAVHESITDMRRRVVCVGAGDSIRKVVTLLQEMSHPHVQVVGHVATNPAAAPAPARRSRFVSAGDEDFGRACPFLGPLEELNEILRQHAIDEVVVASEHTGDPRVGQAVLKCLERHCRVTDQPTFVEKLLGEVPTEDIGAHWFLVADVQGGGGYEAVKRLLDVVVALVGLLLTLPLWALIALGIRLASRGPVFFRQRRVGLHGREFRICKFRTMQPDAEKDGARWADKNDRRVTSFGRFLRLSRLDELPQLWNILKGDMSLIGPRPERPEFVDDLSRRIPHYRQRHLIKPGLTGWAQIHYGYGATVDDARRKLCYDLYYLKHRSVDLDFAILARTIGTFALGAR